MRGSVPDPGQRIFDALLHFRDERAASTGLMMAGLMAGGQSECLPLHIQVAGVKNDSFE